MANRLISLAENGWIPDRILRLAMRHLMRQRLRQMSNSRQKDAADILNDFTNQMRNSPLVVASDEANHQHYEVPTEFFRRVLGNRLKYSCGYWPSKEMTLDQSENAMLSLTCERAQIENGMQILDLGCGWGSLSLWLAEHFPDCQILAVSNSRTQRHHIEKVCAERKFHNLTVQTCDVIDLVPLTRFDRVVSIEMFEHVRNYEELFRRISSWLLPQGKLFFHIFCHRLWPYTFEVTGNNDWMSRHFFTGGIMPCVELPYQFSRDLVVEEHWTLNGMHYSQTCESWLTRLDRQYPDLLQFFEHPQGGDRREVQLQRWRMFFMACSELFRYDRGCEWMIGHYRLHSSH